MKLQLDMKVKWSDNTLLCCAHHVPIKLDVQPRSGTWVENYRVKYAGTTGWGMQTDGGFDLDWEVFFLPSYEPLQQNTNCCAGLQKWKNVVLVAGPFFMSSSRSQMRKWFACGLKYPSAPFCSCVTFRTHHSISHSHVWVHMTSSLYWPAGWRDHITGHVRDASWSFCMFFTWLYMTGCVCLTHCHFIYALATYQVSQNVWI